MDNTEDDDTRKALHDKWKATEEHDKIISAECKLRDFLELQSEDRSRKCARGHPGDHSAGLILVDKQEEEVNCMVRASSLVLFNF